MNTQTLLNRPQILQSTLKLTSLIVKNNREELTQKTLLLRKREKVSKQRIKTFQALNQTVKESDGGLTTGGLLAGGALSRLGIRKPANNIRPFRKPIKYICPRFPYVLSQRPRRLKPPVSVTQ